MSKRFKRQDYFRYKKLGTKWRKAKGIQSKMKIGKGGAGLMPKIGYGSPKSEKPFIIKNLQDLEKAGKSKTIIISSGIGLRKTEAILKKADELGIKIPGRHRKKKIQFRNKLIEKKKKLEKKKEKPKEKIKEDKKGLSEKTKIEEDKNDADKT